MTNISWIKIRGFRNYDDETINFADKTLIIGANDVGKTNLLYVGVTRAIDACYLVQGTIRHNASGEVKRAVPSPFLNENNLEHYRKRNNCF